MYSFTVRDECYLKSTKMYKVTAPVIIYESDTLDFKGWEYSCGGLCLVRTSGCLHSMSVSSFSNCANTGVYQKFIKSGNK